MKIEKLIAGFPIVFLAVLSAQAQGTFQNLNFEQADPVIVVGIPYYSFVVTAASALPGWSGSIGGVPVTQVFLNNYTLGAANIDIFGPGWNSSEPGIIDGNYTVFLQAGSSFTGVGAFNTSLSQKGTIPAGTQSLEFKTWDWLPSTSILAVSFNGNSLSPMVIGTGANYTLYGADLSAFAGQTGQLEFTSVFNNNGPSWIELDDIAFSTTAVPEPSIVALTAIGGLLFGARKWFARR